MNHINQKNYDSRKDEILAKSRSAKKDEGMEHAVLRGNKLGEITMAIVVVPILAIAVLFGNLAVFSATGAAIAAFTFAQCFSEYRFTKRKYHLIWTAFMVFATVACLALFAAVTFGWWEAPKSYFFGLLPL